MGGVGEFFGRPVEEAVATLARENKKIVKLGFSCADAHWNDVINKSMIRNTDVARQYVGTNKRLPTKEQLQSFAKAQGTPLKFSDVGPLHKTLRAKMLDSAKGTQVIVEDAYGDG